MSGMVRGEPIPQRQERERRKSALLLLARLTRESGQEDEAARAFGEAAELEEALAADYGEIPAQRVRHQVSAAGCWAQAGNFLRALELCDALERDESTPEAVRARVALYARTLRERRHRLWSEMLASEPLSAV